MPSRASVGSTPSPAASDCARASRRSSASSEWRGSWWKRTRRRAPTARVNATASSTLEWPQPMRCLVLVLEVLRVVQEQVGAVGDRRARDPVARPGGEVAAPAPARDPAGRRRSSGRSRIRKPTVGPGWTTRRGGQRHASDRPRLPRNVVERDPAGTWRRSIGKSGGEKEREIRSWRLSTGDGGPQMSTRHALVPERREEAEPLEVVEVQVGEAGDGSAACRARRARGRDP